MAKNTIKFLGFGLVLVALGFAVLYGLQYMEYRKTPEYQVMQDMKELEKQYAEDPYGGSTPEETLSLFIDALKKGDIELASKYFVLDEQEQQREDLGKMQERDLLKFMIEDLKKIKLTKQYQNEAFYTLANEQKIVVVEMILNKSLNGRWKIIEL